MTPLLGTVAAVVHDGSMRSARSLLIAASTLVAWTMSGCVLPPIDLAGRACDDLDRCAAGYHCDVPSHTCVSSAEDVDASRLDAEAADARLDASDAGLEDGPLDSAAGDAAMPVCTPACHRLAETCTFAGCELRAYVDGERRPATGEPVVYQLPPAIADRDILDIDFADLPAGFAPPLGLDSLDVIQVRSRTYTRCNFLNLPVRPATHPLIITNLGGQVVCEHGLFSGGANWILTGRSDALSGTGDPGFVGHATGYADTSGTYGFEFRQSLTVTFGPTAPLLGFEIEFVEVFGSVPMASPPFEVLGGETPASALLHDLYVHDAAAGETLVSISGTWEESAFYRNRVLRASGGCMSMGGLGEGTLIRNNVFAGCGLGARSQTPGLYGHAVAIGGEEGTIRFERNLIVGSRQFAVAFTDQGGAGRDPLRFLATDVVVSGVGGDVVSLDGAFIPDVVNDARLHLTRWSATDFDYVWDMSEPSPSPGVGYTGFLWYQATGYDVELVDVHWDAARLTYPGPSTGLSHRPDRINASVGPTPTPAVPVLRDFMPGVDLVRLEQWHAETGRPLPAGPRSFAAGDVVIHERMLYRAANATVSTDVPGVSAVWMPVLPMRPTDDVTLVGPDYAGIGVGP